MRKKLALRLAAAVGAAALLVPLGAAAQPELPPACIVATRGPVHIQLGYAPNGPEDCTVL